MNLNLNLKEFLRYLNKFKWFILTIPVLCIVITYYYVKTLPRNYKSSALIATGITSQFQQAAINNSQSLDYFKLSQQFGNLLEMMKSRRMLSNISYKLILHDLKNPQRSFTEYSDLIKNLSNKDRETAINEYEKRYNSNSFISTTDNRAIKLYDILIASGYNEQALSKNLSIYRNGESDFIRVEYTSHSPELSAYLVNNLSNDFITYYSGLLMAGQQKALAQLDTLRKKQQYVMSEKNIQLLNSSASAAANASGALASQRRSEILSQRITNLQNQKSEAILNISSIEGAIKDIDDKLSGSGGYIRQDNPKDNIEIISIDNQLQIANQQYVNGNFNKADKAIIDSLQKIKSRLIANTSSKSGTNSPVIKQNLINQKIKSESDLASAKSALTTIDNQLNELGPAPAVSGAGASLQSSGQEVLMKEVDQATKNYADVQSKYDQINLAATAGAKLSLVEPGLPGPPEPSKNILYLGFSGASSLILCLMTLLLVFMLNKKINTPEQLERATGHKVLGMVNYIHEKDKDLRNIWGDNDSIQSYAIYKDLLRSLRFELNEKLNGASKVLGIVSLYPHEGKTFLSAGLSYAFARIGKNVLLIVEKESNLMDMISNSRDNKGQQVFESFLVKKQIQVEDRITILNRNASNNSLLELRDAKSLIAGFEILKNTFDTIIIDIDSSSDLHVVKEWLMFCDKSIAVFESGNKITENNLPFIKYLSIHSGFLGWVLNKVPVKNN